MASMIIAGMIGVISFVVTRGITESLITKDMTGVEQFLFSVIFPMLVSLGAVFIVFWMSSIGGDATDDRNIVRGKAERKEEQASLWNTRIDDSYPRATFRGRSIEKELSSYQKGDTITISPSMLKEEKIVSVVDEERIIEKRGALTIRK